MAAYLCPERSNADASEGGFEDSWSFAEIFEPERHFRNFRHWLIIFSGNAEKKDGCIADAFSNRAMSGNNWIDVSALDDGDRLSGLFSLSHIFSVDWRKVQVNQAMKPVKIAVSKTP